MSTPDVTTSIAHVKYAARLDGGYSGDLTITLSEPSGASPLFFIESNLIEGRWVLTPEETEALGEALVAASQEALPPKPWSLESFVGIFGGPVPTEHSRTEADLKRHVRALSDERERQRSEHA